MTLIAPDAGFGLIAGCAVGLAAGLSVKVRDAGVTILLAAGAAGVALLAVVLTALSILVAFLSTEYVALLRRTTDGIEGALRPYQVVAFLSGALAVLGFGAALLYPAVSGPNWRSVILAIVGGLSVWAIAGTVTLVNLTAWHGLMRSRMPEIPEAARDAFKKRQRPDTHSA
jgi:hypothetical protein